MTKSEAKRIQDIDYIPKGESIELEKLINWRETQEDEVYYCAWQTGDDVQSGPIYCGRIADYMAYTPDGKGIVLLCDMHIPERYKKNARKKI